MPVNIVRVPATSARVGAGRKPSNKKRPITEPLHPKRLSPSRQAAAGPFVASDFGVEIGGRPTFLVSDRPRFAHIPHQVKWDLLYAMRRERKVKEVRQ